MGFKDMDFSEFANGHGNQSKQDAKSYLLPIGAYQIKIVKMAENEAKGYIKIYYDIDSGVHTDNFKHRYMDFNFSYPCHYLSFKATAKYFVYAFLKALEESGNTHCGRAFTVDNFRAFSLSDYDGMKVGAVIGQKEYTKSDGSIGISNYITRFIPSKDVGNWQNLPTLKKLEQKPAPKAKGYELAWDATLSDKDVPF